MGVEVDLLINYPRANRDLDARSQDKTQEDRAIARQFDEAFFDGDRRTGYGGFHYDPRFWQPVVPTFREHYGLTRESSILDVGCAKGFMLKDFAELIPGITVVGIDISDYAIRNAVGGMAPFLQVADARDLPFDDDAFDLVISVNTIHNFERDGVLESLREIERVSKQSSFVVVDAYRDEIEEERINAWNLTALTVLSTRGWVSLFGEADYTGDYFWFTP